MFRPYYTRYKTTSGDIIYRIHFKPEIYIQIRQVYNDISNTFIDICIDTGTITTRSFLEYYPTALDDLDVSVDVFLKKYNMPEYEISDADMKIYQMLY